jgi:hypothetical protein
MFIFPIEVNTMAKPPEDAELKHMNATWIIQTDGTCTKDVLV